MQYHYPGDCGVWMSGDLLVEWKDDVNTYHFNHDEIQNLMLDYNEFDIPKIEAWIEKYVASLRDITSWNMKLFFKREVLSVGRDCKAYFEREGV